jgi:hypothetical protein
VNCGVFGRAEVLRRGHEPPRQDLTELVFDFVRFTPAMTLKARAKAPKPIPPEIKAAKARLEKSHKAAKEFEAELNDVIEEAREEGRA